MDKKLECYKISSDLNSIRNHKVYEDIIDTNIFYEDTIDLIKDFIYDSDDEDNEEIIFTI